MPLIVMQWLSLVIQMMSRYFYLFKVNPAYWIQFDTEEIFYRLPLCRHWQAFATGTTGA